MRAALLPAGSDPFLNAYWLRHYARWADQVDELRVIVCNQPDPEVREYLTGIASGLPHVVLTFGPRREHGDVIGDLIEATSADLVMLCEDDAFIRDPAAVGRAFSRIENDEVDVVGCPRASGTPDVIEAAARQYGLWTTVTGEVGPALWPCFFFGRRSDLRATDRHYGAGYWRTGDKIPGLDFIATQGTAADTFSGTTFQLREMGLRFRVEPQYRTDQVRPEAPWFHVGSLSSGHGTYFMGGMAERDRKNHGRSIDDNGRIDWAKRMAWWEKVSAAAPGELPGYHEQYDTELRWLFDDLSLEQEEVDGWLSVYERVAP